MTYPLKLFRQYATGEIPRSDFISKLRTLQSRGQTIHGILPGERMEYRGHEACLDKGFILADIDGELHQFSKPAQWQDAINSRFI